MLRQFGRLADDGKLLGIGKSAAIEQNDNQFLARILTEQANTSVTRGDLVHALEAYQQSLALKEQVGDLQGKAATLHQMGNVDASCGQWDDAERLISEARTIDQRLGDQQSIAFNTVKLGQIAQARGDRETAQQRYREELAIFERLGMPEANQVRGLLASLGAGAGSGPQGTMPEQAVVALDALSPEAQAQLQEVARQFAHLSPDEQQATQMAVRRELLAAAANDVAEAALSARREGGIAELLPKLDEAAAYYADGEAADSPYAQLAGFVRAVGALLRGDPPPPVPQAYVERFAALRQALR